MNKSQPKYGKKGGIQNAVFYGYISLVIKCQNKWKLFGSIMLGKGHIYHDVCVMHKSIREVCNEQSFSLYMSLEQLSISCILSLMCTISTSHWDFPCRDVSSYTLWTSHKWDFLNHLVRILLQHTLKLLSII